MEIIDNVNRLLGNDLRVEIGRGSRVRIAAATFSIFAFEALKDELTHVEQLQFIFTAPTFVAASATDKLREERREFFIPQAKRESSVDGTEFDIRLRNKLTQRVIARECAAWIKEKVECAIAFKEGSVKHVYFVAETKESLSTLQLKGIEESKIECARKFFAALNEKAAKDVHYDVVTDYAELMTLVTGG